MLSGNILSKSFVKPGGKAPAKPVGGMPAPVTGRPIPLMGVMHKGGKVKKTGAYLLKKGEKVQTESQQKKAATNALGGQPSPAAGSAPDEMNIQRLDDGSFHITHRNNNVKEPMPSQKKFSAKNAKHLVKHVRAAYNAPAAEPDADDTQ